MSAPQWKPGDVAAVGDERWMRVVGDMWVNVQGVLIHGTAHVSVHYDYRPLVVIDPEDRETAKTLAAYMGRDNWRLVQEALRSLLDTTPDEPQGLGAVVQDTDGNLWVRWTRGGGLVWRSATAAQFSATKYDDLGFVSVLSEGWSA